MTCLPHLRKATAYAARLIYRIFPQAVVPSTRCFHEVHAGNVVSSLLSRGLIHSVSIPEKKKSYGNKFGRRRADAVQLETAAAASSGSEHEVAYQARQMLAEKPCVYCGFDPTADSLHLGHMLPLIALLHFQRAGHRVIALVGGATAQLGDPSGKDKDRLMSLSSNQVKDNSEAISRQLQTIFSNHSVMYTEETGQSDLPTYRIINNMAWYQNMTINDFYTNVGSHVRISDMLDRTVVSSRLTSGRGISYTEFVYQCFQAYDWLHLYRELDCRVQLGGHDQLGNIEDGYAFIWKSLLNEAEICKRRPALMGLTVPLMMSAAGEKLGKVAGNAVWLTSTTTPGGMSLSLYLNQLGFADIVKFLQSLTFISSQVIERATEMEARGMLLSYINRLLSKV